MIRALLIDDEPDALVVLKKTLEQVNCDMEIVGLANSIESGIESIRLENPDLVFLDIQMPGGSGFDVLSAISDPGFQTIFISAHEGYAIEAVKFHAMDYLLKPVDVSLLKQALDRTVEYIAQRRQPAYKQLLESDDVDQRKRIAVPTSSGYKYIAFTDIVLIKAERNYSRLLLQSEPKPLIISRNLGQFERLLNNRGFAKPHHSYLVNIEHVREFSRTDGGAVRMSNNELIPVGRSYRDGLVEALDAASSRL